jgi:site-specific DNA-methyltransferase (adenine-specific)
MGNDAIKSYRRGSVEIQCGDSLCLCGSWPPPTVIVVDGPYGLGSYPGDPHTSEELPDWYAPHVRTWSEKSLPETTLWLWNTELGWATLHRLFVDNGWEFRNCHIWNKGKAHVAGNANTKTLRKFPVITEVCVQYVRKVLLPFNGTVSLPMKQWLRAEWLRTGLPLSLTNQACGVVNAATRKYFTKDYLWYFPPADHFERLVKYANAKGNPSGRPYFSTNGKRPLTGQEWERMRAKFYCDYGVHNVWSEPPMRGKERLKDDENRCVHANQKPLKFIELIIRASSDKGDVVWEPFGGLCSAAVASYRLGRRCFSAEILPEFFAIACRRLADPSHAETSRT